MDAEPENYIVNDIKITHFLVIHLCKTGLFCIVRQKECMGATELRI